jgi:HAD superfamily hydrolase (TIGR01509 family)
LQKSETTRPQPVIHFSVGSVLRAIIFDFNGVICNDEPLHLAALRKVLGEVGVSISAEEYVSTYLGRDDRECCRTALEQSGKPVEAKTIASLTRRKSEYYLQCVGQNLEIFPGVLTFIREAYSLYELAIASGALRREIEFVLGRVGLQDRFRCIVSCEDVDKGKPDPSIFLRALERINSSRTDSDPLLPGNCLVIEDSQAGVKAALGAGMKCLAVTNSFSSGELAEAHQVVPSLDIHPASLRDLFSP